ncbi:MAG: hypothetical protein J5717_05150 [Lachnospiraceae bacterium]|nr:hypothetical protein [Lachnospiraceae bacterium]
MDNNLNGTNYNAPALEVKDENVLMGTIGAILGALVGAALIALLAKIGYVASISGVVMAFLSLFLYDKFAGKISKKGVIICVVIMIVTVFLTEWLIWSYAYYKELATIYDVSFGDVFKKLFSILKFAKKTGDFVKDIAMLYFFTALGAIPTISKTAQSGTAKVLKDDRSGIVKPESEIVTEEATTADENAVKTFDKDFFN